MRRILTRPAPRNQLAGISASARDSDPYGLDLQLRAELERAFLAGVRHDVGPIEPPPRGTARGCTNSSSLIYWPRPIWIRRIWAISTSFPRNR